ALEPFAQGEPVCEGVGQISSTKLWRITDEDAVAATAAAIARTPLLIADGHHRYETALAYHDEEGTQATEYTMAALINVRRGGVAIYPTPRVARRVPELNGSFRVTPVAEGPRAALAELGQLDASHPAFVLHRRGATTLVEAPGGSGTDAAAVDRLGLNDVG